MTETPNKVDSPLPSVGFKGGDLPLLVTDEPPCVLIAGAGLAGLFLGILLEEAGIPYEIFERSAEIKPFGKIVPSIVGQFLMTPLRQSLILLCFISL